MYFIEYVHCLVYSRYNDGQKLSLQFIYFVLFIVNINIDISLLV